MCDSKNVSMKRHLSTGGIYEKRHKNQIVSHTNARQPALMPRLEASSLSRRCEAAGCSKWPLYGDEVSVAMSFCGGEVEGGPSACLFSRALSCLLSEPSKLCYVLAEQHTAAAAWVKRVGALSDYVSVAS